MALKDPVTFRCGQLSSACFDIFNDMRSAGYLCDLTFKFQNHQISAHRVVIAAVIPGFEEQIRRGEKEIVIMGESSHEMECLIEFAYTRKIETNASRVKNLLSAACEMRVYEVEEACAEFLAERLCPQSAQETLKIAEELGCKKLKESTDKYIYENFHAVSDASEFLNASFEYVKELTARAALYTLNEESVFRFIIKWVEIDLLERQKYLPQLLRNLGTLPFPKTHLNTNAYKKLLGLCKKALDKTRVHSPLRKRLRTSKKSEILPPLGENSPGLTMSPGIYVMTQRSKIIMNWFNTETIEWVTTESIEAMDPGIAVEANNKLHCLNRNSWTYNLNKECWDRFIPDLPVRNFTSATAIGNKLYLFSGPQGDKEGTTVECRDMENYRYSLCTFIESLYSCGVAALNNYLYVIGGQNTKTGLGCRSAKRFSPEEKLWTDLSPMLEPRCFFGCTEMNGKIYVCGGVPARGCGKLSSAEVYDPETDEWSYIASLKTARCGIVLLSYCGKLYAVGGKKIDDVEDCVTTKGSEVILEIYDPKSNEWTYGPTLLTTSNFAARAVISRA